ncbi:hypothetical protein BKC11_18785 [Salmonella enterica subsp. enterica serovar Typhimurium]|nr:hypothetical protein BKC11_18785 [Salmonella enterica subsp. enterica serovar Typhimurium]
MVISMPPGSVIAVAITAICLFYGTLSTLLMKKETLRRLHRHGGCESLHTNSRSVEEKNPEIQG